MMGTAHTEFHADVAAEKERRERDLRLLLDAASLLQGQRQQTVTAKAKEISGALPAAVYAIPQPFALTGVAGQGSDDEEADVLVRDDGSGGGSVPDGHGGGRQAGGAPTFVVLYRMGSFVLVKPVPFSLAPVFLAQLLEHIVEVIVAEDRGNRKRKRKPRPKYTNERPLVRFFMISVSNVRSCDGVAYDFDPGAYKCVSVTAIHGPVESSAFTNISVLAGRLLLSFDIQQDEIDTLESILNEAPQQR
jgi:hypothetical protein